MSSTFDQSGVRGEGLPAESALRIAGSQRAFLTASSFWNALILTGVPPACANLIWVSELLNHWKNLRAPSLFGADAAIPAENRPILANWLTCLGGTSNETLPTTLDLLASSVWRHQPVHIVAAKALPSSIVWPSWSESNSATPGGS